MIDVAEDIRSLTDFKRNTNECVDQIKRSGHAMVLTVNGRAELIVQDARSYQDLLNEVERARDLEAARRGFAEIRAGRTKPLEQFVKEFRRGQKIPR